MRRKLADTLAARFLPHRFLATQLRRPSGRFGRWVMTRALNNGNAELIAATLEALELGRHDSFLDVGFGGGRALQLAAQRVDGPLWGIDFSPDVVAAGTRSFAPWVASGRLNLLTADASALPLRDGLVSAICTTNTIYFWPDAPAVLRELRRVLRSAHGRLAIGYSGAEKMKKFERITQHGFTYYEPAQVEALLVAAGFSRVRTVALQGELTRGDYVTVGVA